AAALSIRRFSTGFSRLHGSCRRRWYCRRRRRSPPRCCCRGTTTSLRPSLLEYARMTINDLSLSTLRVAVIDHGIDGAPAELRRALGAARVVDVFPSLVPDDGAEDASTCRHALSGHPDAVLLTWDADGELASILAATRRVAPDAAIIIVLPNFDEG